MFQRAGLALALSSVCDLVPAGTGAPHGGALGGGFAFLFGVLGATYLSLGVDHQSQGHQGEDKRGEQQGVVRDVKDGHTDAAHNKPLVEKKGFVL